MLFPFVCNSFSFVPKIFAPSRDVVVKLPKNMQFLAPGYKGGARNFLWPLFHIWLMSAHFVANFG